MNAAASNAFNSVALIGKYQSREVAESLRALAGFLSKRGVEVLLEEDTAAAVGANGYAVAGYETIGRRAELAVILGGDGTMLNAARRLAQLDVPLVGINQGRLGFVTDIPLENYRATLTPMLRGLEAGVFVVQVSGPTAVWMAVFGVQFEVKPAFLASVVSWSFLFSVVTMPVLLYIVLYLTG